MSKRRIKVPDLGGAEFIKVHYDSDMQEYSVSMAGYPDATYYTSDKADAFATAQHMRNNYPGRKENPRARKSVAVSGRTGMTKKEYVSRPSRAAPHKAPTKRLQARRKAALLAPKGFYPNPVKAVTKKNEFPFYVQVQINGKWHDYIGLKNHEFAEDHAKWVAKRTGSTVRLIRK